MRTISAFLWASAFLVAATSCSDSSTAPYAKGSALMELTQTIETENFIFHYTPGDQVEVARSEAYHRWAVPFLGVACPKKVDYYKLKDREQFYELIGSTSTGFAMVDEYEVWTYLPWQNHECFHLYALLLGRPPVFFSEGTAVAYQVDPSQGDFEARENSGERVHDVVRRYKYEGRLYPVPNIIDRAGWYASDYTTTYLEAGSFVRYLADVYGLERLKEVFRKMGQNDERAEVKAKFAAIYGRTVDEVEKDWLAFLD